MGGGEVALTAMEEPVTFHPTELQAEKIKVLSATTLAQPLDETTSRGQYAAGWQGGEKVVGLLDEADISRWYLQATSKRAPTGAANSADVSRETI